MTFEIPKEVDKLRKELVSQFKDEVVPIRCSGCGANTFMNARYASVIKSIDNCSNCR
jgi:hypothetical protein